MESAHVLESLCETYPAFAKKAYAMVSGHDARNIEDMERRFLLVLRSLRTQVP